MAGISGPLNVADFIDDRADEGMFRIRRAAFHDEAVFEAEMEAVFERNWSFLCHESQIPNAGDYFATHIGRQPVFAHRQEDGSVRAFVNACSHRGAVLTPLKKGNAKVLTCRFHGWSFNCDGRCVRIKNQEAGFPGDDFDRAHYDLKALPLVGEYRGFIFGALRPDAPSLETHLGESRFFMDFFADQSPDGVEVLPGSQTYVCDHNWKLQAENVTDGYHVGTVHRNFMTTMLAREARDGTEGLLRTETGRIKGNVANGSYYLGGGHTVLWADRASPDAAPLYPATERIERDFSAARAHWMLKRGRNILVFPNMVLNDLASTHMRTHRALSPTRTEITIWCIAPRGEPADDAGLGGVGVQDLGPVAQEVGGDLQDGSTVAQRGDRVNQRVEADDGAGQPALALLAGAPRTAAECDLVAPPGQMIRQVDRHGLGAAGVEAGHQLQDADQGCSPSS